MKKMTHCPRCESSAWEAWTLDDKGMVKCSVCGKFEQASKIDPSLLPVPDIDPEWKDWT